MAAQKMSPSLQVFEASELANEGTEQAPYSGRSENPPIVSVLEAELSSGDEPVSQDEALESQIFAGAALQSGINLSDQKGLYDAAGPMDSDDRGCMSQLRLSCESERLAVKTICASDILEKLVGLSKRTLEIEKKMNRYIKQANLVLTWRHGSSALKVAGSAMKAVGVLGNAMALVKSSDPRFNLAVKVAGRLWKIGTSIKIANALGNLIKDIWQRGCREILLDFTHYVALLTRDLNTFGDVIKDLRDSAGPRDSKYSTNFTNNSSMETDGSSGPSNSTIVSGLCNEDLGKNQSKNLTNDGCEANSSNNDNPFVEDETPKIDMARAFFNTIREFIPPAQVTYVTHVINIVFERNYYAPIFDLASLSTDIEDHSNIAELFREMESFHFPEFVQESNCKSLIAAGSFLHICRELRDFLDSFQNLGGRNSTFLQECLSSVVKESVTFMRAASLLATLTKIPAGANLLPQPV